MIRRPFRICMVQWGAWAFMALLRPPLLAPQVPPANSGGTLPAWISVTPGDTVALTLEASPAGEPGSGLLNGIAQGGVQVVVPLGWTVHWSWRNADSTQTHSLVVMAEREKLPAEGGRPAFTNAMTSQVTAGLRVGQTDATTFEVDEGGWFWMLCGVPGHALRGEWIGLRVDPSAKEVSVKSK